MIELLHIIISTILVLVSLVGFILTLWDYLAAKLNGITLSLIIVLAVSVVYWAGNIMFWLIVIWHELPIPVYMRIISLIAKLSLALAIVNVGRSMHVEAGDKIKSSRAASETSEDSNNDDQ